MSDSFSLFNLEVTVIGDPSTFVCSHKPGLAFRVVGENLIFDQSDHSFSMYSLSALLPLLPAKQRITDDNDWLTTDEAVACPDPHCGAQFVIKRTDQTEFNHDDVTKVPLTNQVKDKE